MEAYIGGKTERDEADQASSPLLGYTSNQARQYVEIHVTGETSTKLMIKHLAAAVVNLQAQVDRLKANQ